MKKEKKDNIDMSKISLSLDNYNDLFSDFDPRAFNERSLSIDFLDEAKRAARDKKEEGMELRLIVPKSLRNLNEEKIIRRRLRDHFKKHHQRLDKEFKKVVYKGVAFVIVGILLMLFATFILFRYPNESFFLTFLIILLEPGGWFLFWEGLDLIIFESKKTTRDRSFYEKMSRASIYFSSS